MPVAPGSAEAVLARRRHYGVFYGLEELRADGPVALVMGNCQAESLRIVLDGGGLATLRVPPVHELEAADHPHLDGWLARARVLVGQPVRDGYRGLPIGTAELGARLRRGGRVVRVPVLRVPALYPVHAIIRPPGEPGATPPLVEYHDLRVLAEAAARLAGGPPPRARLDARAVRAVAALGTRELQRREAAHDTVVASDLFARPRFAQMRTLNHPGNPVWTALAARVRTRLGLPEHDGDPGRPLLDRLHAPRLPEVVEAFGLDDAPRAHWLVDGAPLDPEEVRAAHLAWYAARPAAVAAGLTRHAEALRLLGLPA